MASVIGATDLVRWFHELGIRDVELVGGKNASLGELTRELTPCGVPVPQGFATTAAAYRYFLAENDLPEFIRGVLHNADLRDVTKLQDCGSRIRQEILSKDLPADLEQAIVTAYQELCVQSGGRTDVAVRSSATAEDLPTASFAGQQETYLNVRGERQLLDACRRCFASLYTDRALSYRLDQGFDERDIALSVGVQQMVRSDVGASGVMFTIDTESGFPDVVLINAAYGLGENVVQGTVNPDEFYVFKPTLHSHRPIIKRRLGSKEVKLVYDEGGNRLTKNVAVAPDERGRFAIGDDDILTLARWACQIEDHYSAESGQRRPMDIEWAQDGESGQLYILQARPETVWSQRKTESVIGAKSGRQLLMEQAMKRIKIP